MYIFIFTVITMHPVVLNLTLKMMLGLYLHTLLIGHKSRNMLSTCILNQLTLQRHCKMFWQIVCFWTKVKTQQSKTKPSNIKTLAWNWTRDLSHQKRSHYLPPSELRATIVVKLHVFNCSDAMGRNVKKQSRICVPHIFSFHLLCRSKCFIEYCMVTRSLLFAIV